MTIAATETGDFVKLQPVFRSGFNYAVRPRIASALDTSTR
jgi:hypothetical protein